MDVSIIINNHDYEAFVGEAIASALAQDHPSVEVVVVDDGSTDGSRRVIESFGPQVVAVFQENRGQMAAFRAGFAASRGEAVVMLDADDTLDADAVSTAVAELRPGVDDVQFPLRIMGDGHPVGRTMPPRWDPDRRMPAAAPPPTSGHLWSRCFLDEALAVDADGFRICADLPLYALSEARGGVVRLPRPLGNYRLHGGNHHAGRPADQRFWQEKALLLDATAGLLAHHGHHPPWIVGEQALAHLAVGGQAGRPRVRLAATAFKELARAGHYRPWLLPLLAWRLVRLLARGPRPGFWPFVQ